MTERHSRRRTKQPMAEASNSEDLDSMAFGNKDGPRILEGHDRISSSMAKCDRVLLKVQKQELMVEELKRKVDLLTSTSIGLRKARYQFFEACKKDQNNPYDGSVIQSGNETAHRGDIVTDLLVFSGSMRTDTWVLQDIYGTSWDALHRIVQRHNTNVIKAINARGTLAAQSRLDEHVIKTFEGYISLQLEDIDRDPSSTSPADDLGEFYGCF